MPNPKGGFASAFIAIFAPVTAQAATCDAGYYLNNGKCLQCNPNQEPYYCPGDDIRHPCPKTDTDYTQFGYTLIAGGEGLWAYGKPTNNTAAKCMCDIRFRDEYGNEFLMEQPFNGENYWGDIKLWDIAVAGYWLSGYLLSTGSTDWYNGVKPCTNAPEHAHYTSPGTPDEPRAGGAKDANDCPWECDDGYGRHNDACVPLCTAGIQYIKTGSGLTFNLYPITYSAPALHIKYNGQTCYGALATGAATGAINIKYGDTVYHTVN